MILYFTGTGNSKYVAKRLLKEDEQLLNIADMSDTEVNCDHDRCIIVFPVYFYTVPEIVRNKLNHLTFKNMSYMAAVMTCGGGSMQCAGVLKKLLKANGYTLNYAKEIVMPDNSMLFYQINTSRVAVTLKEADKVIAGIRNELEMRKEMKIKDHTLLSEIVGKGYDFCNKTKKFHALDSCIHCGLCAKNCPEKAIEMKDGKPVWVHETCSKCSSCINRCPVEAIQYGKVTLKRNRYVNPEEK